MKCGLLLLFLLACIRTEAQEDSIAPNIVGKCWPVSVDEDIDELNKLFEGRLVAGFNFSGLQGSAVSGFSKVGINAGGMVYTHFKTMFGLSLELLYSQKGARGANVKESYTV